MRDTTPLKELEEVLKTRRDFEKEFQELREQLEQLAPFLPPVKHIKKSSEGRWTSASLELWRER